MIIAEMCPKVKGKIMIPNAMPVAQNEVSTDSVIQGLTENWSVSLEAAR